MHIISGSRAASVLRAGLKALDSAEKEKDQVAISSALDMIRSANNELGSCKMSRFGSWWFKRTLKQLKKCTSNHSAVTVAKAFFGAKPDLKSFSNIAHELSEGTTKYTSDELKLAATHFTNDDIKTVIQDVLSFKRKNFKPVVQLLIQGMKDLSKSEYNNLLSILGDDAKDYMDSPLDVANPQVKTRIAEQKAHEPSANLDPIAKESEPLDDGIASLDSVDLPSPDTPEGAMIQKIHSIEKSGFAMPKIMNIVYTYEDKSMPKSVADAIRSAAPKVVSEAEHVRVIAALNDKEIPG